MIMMANVPVSVDAPLHKYEVRLEADSDDRKYYDEGGYSRDDAEAPGLSSFRAFSGKMRAAPLWGFIRSLVMPLWAVIQLKLLREQVNYRSRAVHPEFTCDFVRQLRS
jgi:hypothetical protein